MEKVEKLITDIIKKNKPKLAQSSIITYVSILKNNDNLKKLMIDDADHTRNFISSSI
jgi:hypothetical protein